MSTWELRFQFGLLHCKKGHSIFVVRFFCRLTILTHDLFYYRSSLPQNTHIHTHTLTPRQTTEALFVIKAPHHRCGPQLGQPHCPSSMGICLRAYSLFAILLHYLLIFYPISISAFRVARVLQNIYAFYGQIPPSSNSSCFCFEKYSSTHAPTLTSTRTHTVPLTSTPTQTLELTH